MSTRDTRYPCGITRRDSARDFHRGYLNRFDQITFVEWRAHQACGFHSEPDKQPVIREYPLLGGLTLQGSTLPSHARHDLIRPAAHCWNEPKIRNMGGQEGLTEMFDQIFFPAMAADMLLRLVHYNGRGSGMSQPDFHVHMLRNPQQTVFDPSTGEYMIDFFRKSKLVVAESGNVRMVCESIYRVGQCWLISDGASVKAGDIAAVLSTSIKLFADNFQNTATGKEGLPPDFSLTLDFVEAKLRFGSFTPCLAPLGSEQSVMGIFHDVAIPHQWTPERTLELLRLR